ncbi:T9SS type A sorting domain-containing protein, partial [candidate division KSB1 bacterium]|nr:T9SS type A sorting domain-containing protein [candidate division KSB1 bacterium]
TWAENNYQIRFNNNKQLQAISDGGVVSFTTTQQVELGKWYHVIYEMMMAPPGDSVPYYAAFQVRDKDNQIFYNAYAPVTKPVILATSPLRIGKAAGGTYPPYFEGYIDNVQLYNYPAMNLLKGIVGVANTPHTPLAFELSLNYPNPFNPTTEIQFTLPKFQKVNLTIFDVLGKQVKMLVDKKMEPGRYFVSWDGTNDFGLPVSSGIYFYKLRGDDMVKVRKMTLLK